MSSGGGLASLHAGLVQRRRSDVEKKTWDDSEEHLRDKAQLRKFLKDDSESPSSSLSWLEAKREIETRAPSSQPEAPSAQAPELAPKVAPTASEPHTSLNLPRPNADETRVPSSTTFADTGLTPMGGGAKPKTSAKPAEAPLEAPLKDQAGNEAIDSAVVGPAMPAPVPVSVPVPVTAPVPGPVAVPEVRETKVRKMRPLNKAKRKRGSKRRALTVRLDEPFYLRLRRARDETGRTTQDLLETSLNVYLNLINVGVDSDD